MTQSWGPQRGWPSAPRGQGYGSPYGYPGWGGRGFPGQGFPGQQLSPYGRRPPPRRRRSPLRLLLGAAVVIGLIMLAGTVTSNVAAAPPDVSYQNDNYQVPPPDTTPPPLPQPETYQEARQLLTANPFYDQTAPAPVRCEAGEIDVSTASDARLKSHFDDLMACLMRVWEPPVTAAKFTIVRPTVTIYGRSITTKCGQSGVNAFYCSADQQVYYSNQLPRSVPIVARDPYAADVVVAHEFGHALQARTAILISSAALGQQADDKSTELAYSRRLETQADCFSGMFMRSVATALGISQSEQANIADVYRAVGDDTLSGDPTIEGNHGLARSREYWGTTGLGTGDVGACNTYTAASRLVR